MEHDVASDYGSDFTPDEEEILSGLLQQAPVPATEDAGLILRDIEDNEDPPGARSRRLYNWQQHLDVGGETLYQKQKSLPAIEVSVDGSTSTDGERDALWLRGQY